MSLLTGCQSLQGVEYNLSGYSHNKEETSLLVILSDGYHQRISMRPDSGGGHYITMQHGLPKKATIEWRKHILVKPLIRDENGHITQRPEHFTTNYVQDLVIPPSPRMYRDDGSVVLVFHAYECHIEVETLASYPGTKGVPIEADKKTYSYQSSYGYIHRRKQTYHPECPVFDGGTHNIVLSE